MKRCINQLAHVLGKVPLLLWFAGAGMGGAELSPPLSPELHEIVVAVGATADLTAANPAEDVEVWGRRHSAVQKACSLGPNVWPAVPDLIKLTGNPSIEVSVAAATILASVHADHHPEWERLKKELRSMKTGHVGFEHLIAGRDQGMRPYSNARRKFAIRTLGVIGANAEPAHGTVLRLLRSTEDLDAELWADAAFALAQMQVNPQSYVPHLRKHLRNPEESLLVRASAADALAASPADPETMQLLRDMLNDERSQIRLAAARALLRLGASLDDVEPALSPLLRHKLISIRVSTLKCLAELGPRAEPFRSEIQRLLDDPSPLVSQAAAQANEALTR